mmetsp:Transcript_35668/g.113349  ORF Transcript_35668/g.113349 Transcript_35668/m.113349 type:complete len:213 (-) Transcript_35668:260-898(-)
MSARMVIILPCITCSSQTCSAGSSAKVKFTSASLHPPSLGSWKRILMRFKSSVPFLPSSRSPCRAWQTLFIEGHSMPPRATSSKASGPTPRQTFSCERKRRLACGSARPPPWTWTTRCVALARWATVAASSTTRRCAAEASVMTSCSVSAFCRGLSSPLPSGNSPARAMAAARSSASCVSMSDWKAQLYPCKNLLFFSCTNLASAVWASGSA